MRCTFYEQYELGQLAEKDYQEHLKRCSTCQEIVLQDNFLLEQVKKLKNKPVYAPKLWEKIENQITTEKLPKGKFLIPNRKIFSRSSLRIAASLLLAIIVLAGFFVLFKSSQSSGLLTEKALKRVKLLEKAYLDSINQLELLAKPKMKLVNVELALKYRDRLQIIDDQIKLCKEELMLNPTNTHIRRYLLAALQDKKETLIEIQRISLVKQENILQIN